MSLPVKAYPKIAGAPLAGKAVMDTGNCYPARDGQIAEIDDGTFLDSEYLREQLTGTEVVKVFNNIFFRHLLNLALPAGAGVTRAALAGATR